MRQSFFKNIKNFFNGKPEPQRIVENKDQAARVVDFGGNERARIKTQEEAVDNRYDLLEKYDLKDYGMNPVDLIAGETIVYADSKCVQYRVKQVTYQTVTVILTDYKMIIKNVDFRTQITLGQVQKLHKYTNQQNILKLLIQLKDGRHFKLRMLSEAAWRKIYDIMERFSFVRIKSHFFALRHFATDPSLEVKHMKWQAYDPIKQFERMGIKPMPHHQIVQQKFTSGFKFLENRDGRICTTYPQILVVPARISYDELQRCARFRSRNRLPALTFAFQFVQSKWATLYRSSQSKVGVQNSRSPQDEQMLALIGDPNYKYQNCKKVHNCVIFDARGQLAAFGNKMTGKGYESEENYPNCKLLFLNIPNIHSVREAYLKMQRTAHGEEDKFFAGLVQSEWYDFVFIILAGASEIAKCLSGGINVLVHCSDGWDRTSQLCSLAALSLDPFYRTLDGFQILVEKDWFSFGHQFALRMGQGINAPNNQQKSPIFIQFLDCVSQMLHQHPADFQYTFSYLQELAQLSLTHLFGNFLCNCQLQAKAYLIKEKTVSIWSYLAENRYKYVNQYYVPTRKIIQINGSQKNYRFWKQHFLANISSAEDYYRIYSCKFTEENLRLMYDQLKIQQKLLAQKQKQQTQIIQKLKSAEKIKAMYAQTNQDIIQAAQQKNQTRDYSEHQQQYIQNKISLAPTNIQNQQKQSQQKINNQKNQKQPINEIEQNDCYN